jgi:hypothetical protein
MFAYGCEENPMTETVTLGFLGLMVPSGTHVCIFHRGASGRDEIVLPFLAEGIRAQDKCTRC